MSSEPDSPISSSDPAVTTNAAAANTDSPAIWATDAIPVKEGWLSVFSSDGTWDRNYCVLTAPPRSNVGERSASPRARAPAVGELLLFDNARAVATDAPQARFAVNGAPVADHVPGSFDRSHVFAVRGLVFAAASAQEKLAYLTALAAGGARVSGGLSSKTGAQTEEKGAPTGATRKIVTIHQPSSTTLAAPSDTSAREDSSSTGEPHIAGAMSLTVTIPSNAPTTPRGGSGAPASSRAVKRTKVDIDALERQEGLGVIAFAAPIWVCEAGPGSGKPYRERFGIVRDWGLEIYTVDAVNELRNNAQSAGPNSAHAQLEDLTRTAGVAAKTNVDPMSPKSGSVSRATSIWANITLPTEVLARMERIQVSYHHLHQTVTLSAPDGGGQTTRFTHFLKNMHPVAPAPEPVFTPSATAQLAATGGKSGKAFAFSAGGDAALKTLWLAVLQRHARYYAAPLDALPDVPAGAARALPMDLNKSSLAVVANAADAPDNDDDDDDDDGNEQGDGPEETTPANEDHDSSINRPSSPTATVTKTRVATVSRTANAGAPSLDSFVAGSSDRNTKKGSFIKATVSKKKRRFTLDSFDLDLTYITARVIAMGFPSVGTEALYRNDMKDVVRFFETRHPGHYKIYNLCSERVYPKSSFARILHFPFDDHNPPPFQNILFCIKDIARWLAADPRNVAGIHCKAGKGRTGLIIAALMTYVRMWDNPEESMRYYAVVRTKNQKGVTIASQQRWVYMFDNYVRMRDAAAAAATTAAAGGVPPSPAAPTLSPLMPAVVYPTSGLPPARLKFISSIKVTGDAPAFDTVIVTCPCPASPEIQASSPSYAGAIMGTVRSSKDKNLPGFTLTKVKEGLFAPARDAVGKDKKASGVPSSLPSVASLVRRPRVPGKAGSGLPAGQPGNSVVENTIPDTGLAVGTDPTSTGGIQVTAGASTFVVQGDFNVKFIKSSFIGSDKTVFSFWLHSQFVEIEGNRVILHRSDMDKANKTKGNDFIVDITFGDV